MQNTTILLLISTLLLFGQVAHAEAILTGAATFQCGKYLDLLEGDETERSVSEIAMGNWLQGYLSGRNVERLMSDKPVVDIDGYEGHNRWLVNYCEENPLNDVWVGAGVLWELLKARQGIEE